MQVKLYASLRQAAGIKMMDVEIQSGTTIRDVLLEVTQALSCPGEVRLERSRGII